MKSEKEIGEEREKRDVILWGNLVDSGAMTREIHSLAPDGLSSSLSLSQLDCSLNPFQKYVVTRTWVTFQIISFKMLLVKSSAFGLGLCLMIVINHACSSKFCTSILSACPYVSLAEFRIAIGFVFCQNL